MPVIVAAQVTTFQAVHNPPTDTSNLPVELNEPGPSLNTSVNVSVSDGVTEAAGGIAFRLPFALSERQLNNRIFEAVVAWAEGQGLGQVNDKDVFIVKISRG